MSHFTNVCEHGMIVSQCRCPSFNKVHHVVDCPQTQEHALMLDRLNNPMPLDEPESDADELLDAQEYERLLEELLEARAAVTRIEAKIDQFLRKRMT